MGKKLSLVITLDLKYNTFIIHIVLLNFIPFIDVDIHPSYKSLAIGFIAKKAFIKVFAKYANFLDMFSLNLIYKFLKYTRINNHAIKLLDS